MPRQTFQLHTHVQQIFHLFLCIISAAELRIHIQCFLQGNIQFVRNHLGKRIAKAVRQIQHTCHITDHTLCSHRTKGNDLHHLVCSVFASYVIDDLLPSFIAEINIDIGHGHTLRIQESFKKQVITDRINVCDLQTVRNDRACGGTSPRSYRDSVFFCVVDKIPYDQEIIHISHSPDRRQLIVQTFL